MTLRMLDSIYPSNLPAGADAYAGYVDGSWPDFQAEVRKFPGAHVLSIAVFPGDDAEACDCEGGDLAPGQVPGWVARQHRRGVRRPVVYASASVMPTVLPLLHAAGISRAQVRLWSAHYGAGKHICGPATCAYRDGQGRVVPACDGTQWTNAARGANGSRVDESLLRGGFFASPSDSPIRLQEEPVLMNKGAGARTPMALPNGTARVRFFASQAAKIRVDLRDGNPEHYLKLTYGSAHALAIPGGVHAIVVHRVDDYEHDVSAVPSS